MMVHPRPIGVKNPLKTPAAENKKDERIDGCIVKDKSLY